MRTHVLWLLAAELRKLIRPLVWGSGLAIIGFCLLITWGGANNARGALASPRIPDVCARAVTAQCQQVVARARCGQGRRGCDQPARAARRGRPRRGRHARLGAWPAADRPGRWRALGRRVGIEDHQATARQAGPPDPGTRRQVADDLGCGSSGPGRLLAGPGGRCTADRGGRRPPGRLMPRCGLAWARRRRRPGAR
jgi:hypothetical protein